MCVCQQVKHLVLVSALIVLVGHGYLGKQKQVQPAMWCTAPEVADPVSLLSAAKNEDSARLVVRIGGRYNRPLYTPVVQGFGAGQRL